MLYRITHKASNVMEFQLLHNSAAVRLRGFCADPQYRADFLYVLSFGDQLKNFTFANRESIRWARSAGKVSFDNRPRNPWTQISLVFRNSFNCLHKARKGVV